jgi:uncharacterized protein
MLPAPDAILSLRRRIAHTVAVLALASTCAAAQARDLAADVTEMVEVEVATVALAPRTGSPVVLLRQPGETAVIPIFIGPVEAQAIVRGLQEQKTLRPLTHELFGHALHGLGVRLARVFVDDLVDNTYLGMLELHVEGRDQPVLVDSRPSDAIALAVRSGASIHVAPKVLEAARRIDIEEIEPPQVVTALGITVVPATDELRQAIGLPDDPGLLVSGVSGAAETAGMRPGALLLEVNGELPNTPMQFLARIQGTPEGEAARLRYWQDGAAHDVEVPIDVPPRQRPRSGRPGITL